MKRIIFIQTILLISAIIIKPQMVKAQKNYSGPNETLIEKIQSTNGFIALWKFDEVSGEEREATGKDRFPLSEANGTIERVKDGPVSGYSIKLDGTNYLSLPNENTGQLNIYGSDQGITVVAYVKWTGEQTGFAGGMWNEYQDGGKRQYGLFISLPHYNGDEQVCGHISKSGKPTPPFPYSVDYSASSQKVPKNEWCCAAFTYDGTYIKSFLNGEFVPREPELIKHTKGFDGYPDGLIQSKNPYYFPYGIGNNGSDFTVGAVLLKRGMGNFFKGQIGGLAVFNRALDENELRELAELALKNKPGR
jgi:hypothetical protein